MNDPSGRDVLISDLADDPDMLDIVEEFVAELPQRMNSARQALRDGDMTVLRRVAHQMKGAAGGYGFSAISVVAADLENAVRDGADPGTLSQGLEALAALCGRARAC